MFKHLATAASCLWLVFALLMVVNNYYWLVAGVVSMELSFKLCSTILGGFFGLGALWRAINTSRPPHSSSLDKLWGLLQSAESQDKVGKSKHRVSVPAVRYFLREIYRAQLDHQMKVSIRNWTLAVIGFWFVCAPWWAACSLFTVTLYLFRRFWEIRNTAVVVRAVWWAVCIFYAVTYLVRWILYLFWENPMAIVVIVWRSLIYAMRRRTMESLVLLIIAAAWIAGFMSRRAVRRAKGAARRAAARKAKKWEQRRALHCELFLGRDRYPSDEPYMPDRKDKEWCQRWALHCELLLRRDRSPADEPYMPARKEKEWSWSQRWALDCELFLSEEDLYPSDEPYMPGENKPKDKNQDHSHQSAHTRVCKCFFESTRKGTQNRHSALGTRECHIECLMKMALGTRHSRVP